MIEVDRSGGRIGPANRPANRAEPWDSDDVETLRWPVGEVTVFGIGELNATVYEAGLVDLVADDHVVTDNVRLAPSAGHTPHHASVLIESHGESAVITGDVTHHPCQIAHPHWGSTSDFDPAQARASRLELVERYADSDTLIIGNHFADPVVGLIRRQGAMFRLVPADG